MRSANQRLASGTDRPTGTVTVVCFVSIVCQSVSLFISIAVCPLKVTICCWDCQLSHNQVKGVVPYKSQIVSYADSRASVPSHSRGSGFGHTGSIHPEPRDWHLPRLGRRPGPLPRLGRLPSLGSELWLGSGPDPGPEGLQCSPTSCPYAQPHVDKETCRLGHEQTGKWRPPS